MRSMRTNFRAAVLALVAVAALAMPFRQALACSVCLAGDPIYDAEGASAQQKGEINAYFEVRGWTKTSGALAHHGEEEAAHVGEETGEEEEAHAEEEAGHSEDPREKNRGRRLNAYFSWTPLDRLTLTLNVPYNFNKINEEEGHESIEIDANGFGDIALATSLVLWRDREVLPSSFIEGRAFLKTPTGKSRIATDGFRDKHVQPGTGSWDYGFGLAGTHRLEWGSLYSSIFYRINGNGSLDYTYGDVFLANAAVTVPLGHALKSATLDPVTPGLELNYRWAEKDVSHGEDYEDSGGSILYATPFVRVQLPWFESKRPPTLRAAVQIPLTNAWLHGYQREDPVWSVGIQVPF